jgi:SAM-dependent methyltransferase
MSNSNPNRPKLERTSTYTSGRIEYRVILPMLRKSILEGLEQHATAGGSKALDAGCGEQPFRGELERRGYLYTSFDVGQNVLANVDELGFIDGELPQSLIARGPFDFILCTEVLEHVADWTRAFQNLDRLLAPGGRVLITCPHLWPLHEEPYDFWRPTPYALRYFAERHGLTILEQKKTGSGFEVLAIVLALTSMEAHGPRLWRWLTHGAYAVFKRVCVSLLSCSFVRRFFTIKTGLYINNFLVLQKSI